MTVRNGGGPRSGGRGGSEADQARRPVVDMGWDDFAPPAGDEGPQSRHQATPDIRRDYRSGRWRGPGHIIRFAVFALLLGGLVTGGLYFVVRPVVVGRHRRLGGREPYGAVALPFVADVVRSELGSELDRAGRCP